MKFPRSVRLLASLCLACVMMPAFASSGWAAVQPSRKPNIIVIIADDLGYGDAGCYGATKVKTPNVDKLAAQGIRFTDGHCTASTCTPSRYSLLTGEYAFRNKRAHILAADAPLLIDPKQPTLQSLLRDAGYATGCVGKWHLGLAEGDVDWNGDIKPGPLEVGFDYSFIVPATGDRVPCVYIEGHKVVGGDPNDPLLVSYKKKVGNEPTGKEHPELLKMKLSHGHDQTIINGISRIGYMAGAHKARWTDEEMAQVLTKQAVSFIEKNREKPFFLYFATHDIHVPRAPNKQFAGSSQCGIRGDVIQQFDWSVGQVSDTLDRLGIADNTLIVITSDNGPVIDDGYADGAKQNLNGHTPGGPLKGGKYTIWEGGTRVPFITRWTGRIKPGTSSALVSQVDFTASFVALAGKALPSAAGPDSFNVLPALLGESQSGRETYVEQSNGLALRKGQWKFIPPGTKLSSAESAKNEGQVAGEKPGGNAEAEPAAGAAKGKGGKKGAPSANGLLFNVADDIGEAKDIAAQHADIAKQMAEQLKQIEAQPQSRPGK